MASGDVERHAEAKKISNNEYQIDAEKNGLDFYGVAIGKDTGVFGPRMQELLVRMTSIRHGEEYENDPINQYGYTAGLWSAPTALDYWCKVLLVRLVARRETYVDQACVRARRATRNGHVGGGGFRAWHAEVQRVSTLAWLYVEGIQASMTGEANRYIARAGRKLVPPRPHLLR